MDDFRFIELKKVIPSGASRIYKSKSGDQALVMTDDFDIYLRNRLSSGEIKQEKLFQFKHDARAAEKTFAAFGVAIEKFGEAGLQAIKSYSFDVDQNGGKSTVYLRVHNNIFGFVNARNGYEEIEINILKANGTVSQWCRSRASSVRTKHGLETIQHNIDINQRFIAAQRSISRFKEKPNEYALGE